MGRAFKAGLAFFILLALPFSSACPYDLVCGNFTDSNKISDCEYIVNQNLPEEQDLLCILWDQEYGFNGYNPPNYPDLDVDLAFNYHEINTSRFITAIKILLFFLFNYFVYSVITKPNKLRRLLND